jgi:hypothetical protein
MNISLEAVRAEKDPDEGGDCRKKPEVHNARIGGSWDMRARKARAEGETGQLAAWMCRRLTIFII